MDLQEEMEIAKAEKYQADQLSFNCLMRIWRLEYCVDKQIQPHEIVDENFYQWMSDNEEEK